MDVKKDLYSPLPSFMRPNTPHYVWSMEHSITLGRHFHTTSTIKDTCHQIVHSFVMQYTITNAKHPHTRSLLRRLLSTWVNFYLRESAKTGECFDFAFHDETL